MVTVSDGKGGTANASSTGDRHGGQHRADGDHMRRTPTGNVTTGTAIAFTAVGTDADGDTLTYAWNFGDTTTSAVGHQNPSKTYTSAGHLLRHGHGLRRQGRDQQPAHR